jgi:hypothetical protein
MSLSVVSTIRAQKIAKNVVYNLLAWPSGHRAERKNAQSLFENSEACRFRQKGWMARRDD